MQLPSPNIRLSSIFFFATFLVMLSAPAFAALGGNVSSVQADQAHMKAQRRVTQTLNYTLHEMQDSSGVVVREFVSPEGKVFGVAWQGPARPDLQQALGSYYQQFVSAAPQRRTHGPVSIQVPGLVLESGGHQRSLTGRAYVPEMVPENVKLEEIK